jgi:hypothetical protein
MIHPTISAFLSKEGITLGYYLPGDAPVLSHWIAGRDHDPDTHSYTYLHEIVHEDLTNLSPYGQFCIVLNGVAKSLPELGAESEANSIGKVLDQLRRSSFVLQEGCATSVELMARLMGQSPEALKRRRDGLPLPYYLSVQHYEPLWTGVIQAVHAAGDSSLLVPLIPALVRALASACLSVDILHEFDDYAIISPASIADYLSSRESNPDERLKTLTQTVRDGVVSFSTLIERVLVAACACPES